ncbi:hypothetical protein CBR_g20363 [Chara braunii]|uniref:RING-type domain-containing protein n=1 Tax=Chara braunii TaxID=69332 RepID=A0A388JU47_CHABU|nr:hypothetical protein CBR_g20363 [Chara braunii]|eukprot:GBG61328.1 hypothetical protein CBR_g20363 [Chara braunii]
MASRSQMVRDPYSSSLLSTGQMRALQRLVDIDLRRLCDEAKVEKCRATRDVRSCGKPVRNVLTECGHAVLCAECMKRVECCPVCRAPIVASDTKGEAELRLYDLCQEAELVPDSSDDDLDDPPPWTEDVARLYAFFDIALEHNQAVLVRHYVEEVCLDDNAVSSDAVISKMLDGTVVVEWCRAKLNAQKKALGKLYSFTGVGSMGRRVNEINRMKGRMEGVIHVLESLKAPSPGDDFSPVDQLQEFGKRALQHARLMMWCMRNRFLEDLPCRFSSSEDWSNAVHERKVAAQERQWPGPHGLEDPPFAKESATLFIQDAVDRLGLEEDEDESEWFEDLVESGAGDRRGARQMLWGSSSDGCRGEEGELYPFLSIRSAVDILFLSGSSDDEQAKKAILLYYLFDRFWGISHSSWLETIDDYCAFLGITRNPRTECLVFFLLDETSEQALQEACQWIPVIAGPSLHPKVLGSLVERGAPHVALDALRASGSGGILGSECHSQIPLSKAIIALRVLIQSGLLADGYLYQYDHWRRVREMEENPNIGINGQKIMEGDGVDDGKRLGWKKEMEVLVTEICWICIRDGWLGNLIKLPWSQEEESILSQYLMNEALREPHGKAGAFLVTYYILRCRYIEAEKTHAKLLELEQQCIQQNPNLPIIGRMMEARKQRTKIVEACHSLVSDVERKQFEENVALAESTATDQDILSSPSASGIVQDGIGVDSNHAEGMRLSPVASLPSLLPNLQDPSPLLQPGEVTDGPLSAKLQFPELIQTDWQPGDSGGHVPGLLMDDGRAMGMGPSYGMHGFRGDVSSPTGEAWGGRELDFESPVRLLARGAGSPYVSVSREGVSSYGWQQSSGRESASGSLPGSRLRRSRGMASHSTPSSLWVNASLGSPGSMPARRLTPPGWTSGFTPAPPQSASRFTPSSLERFNTPIMTPSVSLGYQGISPSSFISPTTGTLGQSSFQLAAKRINDSGLNGNGRLEFSGGKDRWRAEQDGDEDWKDEDMVFATPRSTFKTPGARVHSLTQSRFHLRRTAAGYV